MADAPSSPGASSPSGVASAQHPGIIGLPPAGAAYAPPAAGSARGLGGDEFREVLAWISAFVPTRVELFPVLKPFLPEYSPALGHIDTFVKVRAGGGGSASRS